MLNASYRSLNVRPCRIGLTASLPKIRSMPSISPGIMMLYLFLSLRYSRHEINPSLTPFKRLIRLSAASKFSFQYISMNSSFRSSSELSGISLPKPPRNLSCKDRPPLKSLLRKSIILLTSSLVSLSKHPSMIAIAASSYLLLSRILSKEEYFLRTLIMCLSASVLMATFSSRFVFPLVVL